MMLSTVALVASGAALVGTVMISRELRKAREIIAMLRHRADIAEAFVQLLLNRYGDAAIRTCDVCGGRIGDSQQAAVRCEHGAYTIAHALCLPPMEHAA